MTSSDKPVNSEARRPTPAWQDSGDWLPDRYAAFARDSAAVHGAAEKALETLRAAAPQFAEQIHAAYAALPSSARSPDVSESYDDLDDWDKRSNEAAVGRVPGVLNAAGMRVAEGMDGLSLDHAAAWLDLVLDTAAAEEHAGWMQFHLDNGWMATDSPDDLKNKEAKRHPALRPWAELSEVDKDKDRAQVRLYVRIVYALGFGLSVSRNHESANA